MSGQVAAERIVVGVDAKLASAPALSWAAADVEVRGWGPRRRPRLAPAGLGHHRQQPWLPRPVPLPRRRAGGARGRHRWAGRSARRPRRARRARRGASGGDPDRTKPQCRHARRGNSSPPPPRPFCRVGEPPVLDPRLVPRGRGAPSWSPGPFERIVVGVDGSPASSRALRWAVRHAIQPVPDMSGIAFVLDRYEARHTPAAAAA